MHDELSVINRWLGGISASLRALIARLSGPTSISLVDLGSGGCDVPRALVDWARAREVEVRVLALDLSRVACREMRERTRAYPEIECVVADGCRLPLADGSVDAAHAALLFHHLSDADAARMLAEMRRVSRRGALINDLHRHPFAWAAIRVLTAVFSRSRLIRHDAPLSVRRGFTREELAAIARASNGVPETSWQWAFRLVCWVDA